MLKFPHDFLWGAATSAHQVEGDNINSDWWAWEKAAGKEPSGQACRHYECFEQDFDLAKELGHNAHRLSIEWARIEPQDGVFSQEAIRHYADVIQALRRRGIEPVVTLHHFTNPQWLTRLGGWESRVAAGRFVRYAQTVVRALAPHVRYWITINEPTILSSHAYLFGVWPPQVRSLPRSLKVLGRLSEAHIAVYRKIHAVYRDSSLPAPAVSIAHHMMAVVPCTGRVRDRFAAWLRDYWFNFQLLDRLTRARSLDFIGVNYYSRHLVHWRRWTPDDLFGEVCSQGHHPCPKNSLGWDVYPEGLFQVLMKTRRYGLAVIVMENGICTDDDGQRWGFIRDHLASVHRAMGAGVAVKGYFYWSLMDNFEWDKGFAPRFGLVHVDYPTGQRTPRESARKYAEVCRGGCLAS